MYIYPGVVSKKLRAIFFIFLQSFCSQIFYNVISSERSSEISIDLRKIFTFIVFIDLISLFQTSHLTQLFVSSNSMNTHRNFHRNVHFL